MNRTWQIGILCNSYPVLIVGHIVFGTWAKFCLLLFNVIPIAIFGGLLWIWSNTSAIKLNAIEVYFIRYLVLMIAIIYCYFNICVISTSTWVYSHNTQFTIFIAVTGLYYIYELGYKNAKR